MIEEIIAKVLVYKCSKCKRIWISKEDADAHDCKPKESHQNEL